MKANQLKRPANLGNPRLSLSESMVELETQLILAMYTKFGIISYGDDIVREHWEQKHGALIGWSWIAALILVIASIFLG